MNVDTGGVPRAGAVGEVDSGEIAPGGATVSQGSIRVSVCFDIVCPPFADIDPLATAICVDF